MTLAEQILSILRTCNAMTCGELAEALDANRDDVWRELHGDANPGVTARRGESGTVYWSAKR